MPNSLVGFANQSQYVGVGLKCKQFTNRWYTTNFKSEDKVPSYSSTVKPSMVPEKQLVYEVFALLKTHKYNPERKSFDIGYVSSVGKDVTVELKREVLERSMKESPATTADQLLASVSVTYKETMEKESVDPAEELDSGDADELTSEEMAIDATITTSKQSPSPQKISKKKMHDLIGKDLYQIGREEFTKKGLLSIHAESDKWRINKS